MGCMCIQPNISYQKRIPAGRFFAPTKGETFSYLPVMTEMIEPFDLDPSPLQAKGWTDNWSFNSRHHRAGKPDRACPVPALIRPLISSISMTRQLSEWSRCSAQTLTHIDAHSPTRFAFGVPVCSLRCIQCPSREMETLLWEKTLSLTGITHLKINISGI